MLSVPVSTLFKNRRIVFTESPRLIAMTSISYFDSAFCKLPNAGISALHGAHQSAQKLMIVYFPNRSARLNGRPSRYLCSILGAIRVLAAAAINGGLVFPVAGLMEISVQTQKAKLNPVRFLPLSGIVLANFDNVSKVP